MTCRVSILALRSLPLLGLLAGCDLALGLRRDADAAIDVPPESPESLDDRDADGVANQDDNCPDLANPGQHDEDIDGFGDACDACPHQPAVTNDDSDTDGVGDACDPRPSTPGDQLAIFDGFNDPLLSPRWRVEGSAWSTSSGSVEVTATGVPARLSLEPPAVGEIRIEAELVVSGSVGATGGVLLDYRYGGNLCGLRIDMMTKRGLYRFDPPTYMVDERAASAGGTAGSRQRFRAHALDGNRTCSVDATSVVQQGWTSPHVDYVGVAAIEATMRVSWIVVIISS